MLLSIGMLHYQKNPTEVRKAYPFAAVAKMEGIPFYYFTFNNVDFKRLKINGWEYIDGEWTQTVVDFPTVIINSCNPKTKKQNEISKRLKEYVLFTSYPVGNKLKVYKKVLHGKQFSRYLIPSTKLRNPAECIRFFDEQSRAVIKPLSGNQGKKVLFIEKLNDQQFYQLTDGQNVTKLHQKELETLIADLILERKYLLQPFIECKTKNELTYDFRLHVQKNGSGLWEINLIYPRISGDGKLISNISSGGYRGDLEPFLLHEFDEESDQVKLALEQFALSFSSHFESLYAHSFDELGIDVGIDKQYRLWIFEVNWRPGCKHREFEVARRLIPYCQYLANFNLNT
ncbi:YheC/YheD family protein [Bacillus sp. sid0103]|uniref:YheC/YheD family protein n=1 Tax=Bacillus sp. sid0103 TaxID=2856337 RepID=UPI001C4703E9|nr:YheC/YheD family protein [Bacillus sp. sid0103]MBV7508019.1 YheC/YheD family protein [Bacillus sp. sid0103]